MLELSEFHKLIVLIHQSTDLCIIQEKDGSFSWGYRCTESDCNFGTREQALGNWIQWACKSMDIEFTEPEEEEKDNDQQV